MTLVVLTTPQYMEFHLWLRMITSEFQSIGRLTLSTDLTRGVLSGVVEQTTKIIQQITPISFAWVRECRAWAVKTLRDGIRLAFYLHDHCPRL